MVAMPKSDKTWMPAMEEAAQTLMEKKPQFRLACSSCQFKRPEDFCKGCKNRRGNFRALSVGVSYGGGQKVGQSLFDLITFNPLYA